MLPKRHCTRGAVPGGFSLNTSREKAGVGKAPAKLELPPSPPPAHGLAVTEGEMPIRRGASGRTKNASMEGILSFADTLAT